MPAIFILGLEGRSGFWQIFFVPLLGAFLGVFLLAPFRRYFVAELHGNNNLNKQTALTEKGAVVNGRGDTPNLHDILTGSNPDGTAAIHTCGNWTSPDAGAAIVGHHDRQGLNTSPPMLSWSTSHPTRGCSIPAFNATGGGGLFYCFAAN